MDLIRFLVRTSGRLTCYTGLMSLLSGAFSFALVAVVHRTLTGDGDLFSIQLPVAFILVGVGKLVTGYFSEVMLTGRAQRAIAALRLDLIRKLQCVPFRKFEQIGQARVLSTLTEDVGTLSQAFYVIPAFAVNVAVVCGGLVYLVYLSVSTLVIMCLLSLVGAFTYRRVMGYAHRLFGEARDERDRLHGHFVELTHGMKELKLHRPRRKAYTERETAGSINTLMGLDVKSHNRYIFAHSSTHFFLLLLMGIVLFALPNVMDIPAQTISGYVLTAIFLMGPLNGVAGAFPLFSRASVSLDRIHRMGVSLNDNAREQTHDDGSSAPTSFNRIELREMICRYEDEGEDTFVLGPVNMTILPGEIVYLTGGNGSGKSTLAKIITGLYSPDVGRILLDGEEVTDTNRDKYRQLFSAVFADFFLFESLLGLDAPDLDERAARYLGRLELKHKVRVEGGALSTTQLSTGQRKRLALLTSYLENRPVYLFDEWAADQDPVFKDVFYKQILPELKSLGKTVIVVTHDDRYFDLADRRFSMRDGKMIQVSDDR